MYGLRLKTSPLSKKQYEFISVLFDEDFPLCFWLRIETGANALILFYCYVCWTGVQSPQSQLLCTPREWMAWTIRHRVKQNQVLSILTLTPLSIPLPLLQRPAPSTTCLDNCLVTSLTVCGLDVLDPLSIQLVEQWIFLKCKSDHVPLLPKPLNNSSLLSESNPRHLTTFTMWPLPAVSTQITLFKNFNLGAVSEVIYVVQWFQFPKCQKKINVLFR